jgi:threonyl-tRNA synthetase
MIHAAIMGSIERFMGTLIEHTAGNFPLWLSPVQVRVLPIGEAHHAFAKEITDALKKENMRAELDDSKDGLGKKVRGAKVEKIPYWLVIGDKEVEAKKPRLKAATTASLANFPSQNYFLNSSTIYILNTNSARPRLVIFAWRKTIAIFKPDFIIARRRT